MATDVQRRRQLLLLTLLGSSARQSYEDAVETLIPDLWYSMRATSGANEANRGALGVGYDAAITGGITLAQVGQLGVNQAHDIDGTTGYYQVTTGAGITGGTFWWGYLVNPDTAGELNAGRFFSNGTANGIFLRFSTTLGVLNAVVAATGAGNVATTTGLSAGAWAWVFMAYDNSGAILGDRGIHLYKGDIAAGTITEYAYSANTLVTGTFAAPTGNLFLGNNNTSAAVTFDGKMDEVLYKASLPATVAALKAQWLTVVLASRYP